LKERCLNEEERDGRSCFTKCKIIGPHERERREIKRRTDRRKGGEIERGVGSTICRGGSKKS